MSLIQLLVYSTLRELFGDAVVSNLYMYNFMMLTCQKSCGWCKKQVHFQSFVLLTFEIFFVISSQFLLYDIIK